MFKLLNRLMDNQEAWRETLERWFTLVERIVKAQEEVSNSLHILQAQLVLQEEAVRELLKKREEEAYD